MQVNKNGTCSLKTISPFGIEVEAHKRTIIELEQNRHKFDKYFKKPIKNAVFPKETR